MTVVISFASSDGHISSHGSTYAVATTSGTRAVMPSATNMYWGQNNNDGTYQVFEAFLSFPYVRDTTKAVVTAFFEVYCATTSGTAINRSLQFLEYDWGGTLEGADWQTPAQLTALNLLGLVESAEDASPGQRMRGSVSNLAVKLRDSTTGSIRVVAVSGRTRENTTASGDEGSSFWASEVAGTSLDPRIVYSYMPISSLMRVGGAQIMLSDGSTVYLEHVAAPSQNLPAGTDVLRLRRRLRSGTTSTIGGAITVGTAANTFPSGIGGGWQCFALFCDASDNLYLISRNSVGSASLVGQCFWRSGSGAIVDGTIWTGQTALSQAFPSYGGAFPDFHVGTWHSTGGSNGTGVVITSSPPGFGAIWNEQSQVLFVNCDSLRNGSGALLRGTSQIGTLFAEFGIGHDSKYHNPWGTGADIVATSALRGYAISHNGDDDVNADPAVTRYTLNTDGVGFSATSRVERGLVAPGDNDSKLRVVRISDSLFCASGGTVPFDIMQSIGDGTAVGVSRCYLSDIGLASLPASLGSTTKWDVIYDPAGNRLILYYLDQANSRRLIRTSFDLATMLPLQEEVVISSGVGASGSTNYSLRMHRGDTYGDKVMISVGNLTGSLHSAIYVEDTLNVAPTPPILAQRLNYDATAAATFGWTFVDPNPGDTQSAYQLEITNVATETVVYDSGKTLSTNPQKLLTAGTLSNPGNYQWRVRTWDAADLQGPYSTMGTFQTAAGGTVSIIDPSADNPPGLDTSHYPVIWQVTGSTQAGYYVRLVRVFDEAAIVDTGWVTSTDTFYTVQPMSSDVLYRVEVTTRNAALVQTNTANRLLTPSYGRPEQPALTVQPQPENGYTRVVVDNPLPGQPDTGQTPDGFEAGVTGYTISGGTLVQSVDVAYEGTHSALLTVTGSPATLVFRRDHALAVPVTPGVRYQVRFRGYSPVALADLGRVIRWLDVDRVQVSTESWSITATPAGAWTDQAAVFTAPPGAAYASGGLDIVNAPNGTQLYLDQFVLLGASNRPEVSTNRLYRRPLGSTGTYRFLGALPLNGSYLDYEAAGAKPYEYVVRGVSSNLGSTDSVPVVGRLDLIGLWIHDPYNPAGTIRHYPYGKSARSVGIDVNQAGQVYAGRRYQVVDYGESQSDTFRVQVDIPISETWMGEVDDLQAFSEARRTLCFRDNRGRLFFGTMSGYAETDEDFGTRAQFTITRLDYFQGEQVSL